LLLAGDRPPDVAATVVLLTPNDQANTSMVPRMTWSRESPGIVGIERKKSLDGSRDAGGAGRAVGGERQGAAQAKRAAEQGAARSGRFGELGHDGAPRRTDRWVRRACHRGASRDMA